MNVMTSIWRFLTSRNTGIMLLIAVSAVLLIGAMLPNPEILPPEELIRMKIESPLILWLGENFNSMKVGRSYAFGIVGLLLVLSTSFCSIERIIRKVRPRASLPDALPPEQQGSSVTFAMKPSDIEAILISLLKRDRWSTQSADSGDTRVITASKGNAGFWGSIFFHAVLISLIAGLIVYYFSALYATLLITEGQRIELSKDSLSSITRMPVTGLRLPPLSFRFNKFTDRYYSDYSATDFTADFDIEDLRTGNSWNQIIRVNEPFRYGGMDFIMILQGYSPNFILYEEGKPVFDSFVALNYVKDAVDSFQIADRGISVSAEFFPDMKRDEKGGVYSDSPRPRNPYFGLEISMGDSQVFKGLVGRGESASFGPFRLEFRDLKHWITLNLVRETGIGFFFVCAMIGLAGLLIRVLDPERRITARISDTGTGAEVRFSYSARHFDGILKEQMNDLVTSLKGKEAE